MGEAVGRHNDSPHRRTAVPTPAVGGHHPGPYGVTRRPSAGIASGMRVRSGLSAGVSENPPSPFARCAAITREVAALTA